MGDPVAWREEWCRHGNAEARSESWRLAGVFGGGIKHLILFHDSYMHARYNVNMVNY